MAREPRVRLDRQRIAAQRLRAVLDRRREAVAVTLVGQVTLKLGNEQATVREDEHAEGARRLDEPGSRDRLAGCGRVAEAVAAHCARVRAAEALLLFFVVGVERVLRGIFLGL